MLQDEKDKELDIALANLTVKDEPLETNNAKEETLDKKFEKSRKSVESASWYKSNN